MNIPYANPTIVKAEGIDPGFNWDSAITPAGP